MAFNKIRGQQIKNGAITAAHIQNNTINGDHLAQSAIQAVLNSKLVVDYVQLAQPITVPETGMSAIVPISGDPVATGNLTDLGVLLDKKVIVRNAETGDAIYNPDHKHEVFGRLTHDGSQYTLEFGCYETDGSFTAYEFPTETKLDVQYAQRFTLATVDEMFAANEKFVDGAVDVTTAIKIKELQEKLEKLAGDSTQGIEDIRIALQEQIDAIKEVIGTDATEDSYVLTEDQSYDGSKTYYKQDSNSYVEIAGEHEFIAGGVYEKIPGEPATGIKAILAEHESRLDGHDAKLAEVDTTLAAHQTKLDEHDNRLEALEKAEEEVAKKLGSYKKFVAKIDAQSSKTEILLPDGMLFKKLVGVDGLYEDNLYVYVNGLLQAEDINYQQIEDDTHTGFCKGVMFVDDQLMEDDIIIVKWINEVVQ